MNIQAMRSLSAQEAFLTIAARLCDIPITANARRAQQAASVTSALNHKENILHLLKTKKRDARQVHLLIPELQQLFTLFSQESQADLYVFLDDVHYLSIGEQPKFLDMIHSLRARPRSLDS
jgi:hypothetical protein